MQWCKSAAENEGEEGGGGVSSVSSVLLHAEVDMSLMYTLLPTAITNSDSLALLCLIAECVALLWPFQHYYLTGNGSLRMRERQTERLALQKGY